MALNQFFRSLFENDYFLHEVAIDVTGVVGSVQTGVGDTLL